MEHDWPREARAGRAIQDAIAPYVDTRNSLPRDIQTVAGVDIGFEDRGATTRAAVVVLDAADLGVVAQALVRRPTRMPYIPGLLSFREIPAALDALEQLSILPDLLMVDGHGIAHPRRLGVATHLGLVSGLPTIGVAKKRLTGTHDAVPEQRLAWTALTDGDETIGAVLRSRVGVKPIFTSPGHRIDLGTAIEWTARTLTRYRLPETTRAADRLASRR
ncbi:deoxyribonuclease V [Salinisphaera sp. RV14]|uniref:deoxyribonuclease V n=1 Tax=unclassified Salinisphaera TaxID=2649847 RepID=UPI003F84EF40